MTTQTAMFGAGCFWSVEHAFRQVDGVIDTEVGYAGGSTENPTYEQVCTDQSGHAEVVRMTFDPARITYESLLGVFFSCHNPTQRDRQGADVGRQYRSIVFARDAAQRAAAEKAIADLDAVGKHDKPIATRIEDAPPFYRAEEIHQRYVEKNGSAACGI